MWALKMPHFREAEFLHLRLSSIEHVFLSMSVALIFAVYTGIQRRISTEILKDMRESYKNLILCYLSKGYIPWAVLQNMVRVFSFPLS